MYKYVIVHSNSSNVLDESLCVSVYCDCSLVTIKLRADSAYAAGHAPRGYNKK